MVSVQLGVSADNALFFLQGQAFKSGRPVERIPREVVERRVRYEP
jgi:hypothetical protein